jgi:hypothetical protein
MKKYGLVIMLIIFFFDLGFSQLNPTIYQKTKKIKLSNIESKAYLAFENYSSIIYLDKRNVIDNLRKHLNNKMLCELRRLNYNKILQRLNSSDSCFFIIEPTMSPEILSTFGGLPNLDTITGYQPLDYYAERLQMNISKDYIPPYGFRIEIDTLGKSHLYKYYTWMISELVLNGKAKIYNKEDKKYEKIVYFKVVRFEGHGGETLLFSNKKPFYSVDTYSDIILPDFECGDNYEGYKIIE